MRKKFKVSLEKEILLLCCDRCKSAIEDENKVWKKGAYQTGENSKGGIGTWCSKNCELIYETKMREIVERKASLSL